MTKRICTIGISKEMFEQTRSNYFGPIIHHDVVPKIVVMDNKVYIEKANGPGMLSVDKVVFHGIYENDFDLLTGLCIWDGPCFPNAHAMMNCRLKLPGLARALKVSRFNSARGFLTKNTEINASVERVAKWGNWHCGENKHRFIGLWKNEEAAIIEPFFNGSSVRLVIIGKKYWQIKLEGKSWLKSIHDETAAFMNVDEELLQDTLRVKKEFGMDLIANDYIIENNGKKHLLEVNHIPNVTRFKELRSAYIEAVIKWING